ncbi:PucR family transcriptional regulator ligand-binding domain-containing protein [Streptomyces sp. SL13]|uniref:PucR family transcriptional regulator ligand-binding domain-containing protein n=1 Tax=Streptantibioticus silvisoli TaxID=2705255 RepID=A0AA90HBG3_9ACTN|nr:PucR family transcriptional regulator ligand-binding domain-containing protein [Streptantibioticus silvisoli]MDI5971707.1 PucR family transcriptional regulator ligand-binding domain-containing protein [Streptantibioticus silvisoli]
MRLRALLDEEGLGLRLLGGAGELDRAVRGVMTTDLRDPSRYLSGGELVLTGLAWRRGPEDCEPFVRRVAAAGAVALAAGEAEIGGVPDDLVAACARHRLPVFAVDERVAFATITEYVVRRVSGGRARELAAVVERHRRLMASGTGGGGPDAVLDLLAGDLDLRAWVLSCTGRPVAGPVPGPAPQVRARLAGDLLAAARVGHPVPLRVEAGGRVHALFPVTPGGVPDTVARPAAGPPRADWLLAVESDPADWPAERLELLGGVARLIAAGRERRDAAAAVRDRLADEVLALVRAGAAPAEVDARLRAAAPVMVPAAAPDTRWQVVTARLDPAGEGAAARPLLEEVVATALGRRAELDGTPDAAADSRGAVGVDGGEAVALLALPGPRALTAGEVLAAVGGPLARGLEGVGRLTVGLSSGVGSAEGLRGALEEARHARRVAAARPGAVGAAGHEELASHVLLLPFVPDDVRHAFTARLLDPLVDYDRRHRAELVPTLEAFLDCDGSWTRCAARLHLHVNTLRYRIGRIEALTGRELSRLEDKVDFFLALRVR